MHPSDTIEADKRQSRWQAWRAIRWLVTAAASLVLVTLFLTQAATTEAAAPAATDTAVYQAMQVNTCQQGFNCIANNCLSGNYYFCGYNLGATYPYNFGAGFGVGCGIGGLNCGFGGVNYVFPAVVNNGFPLFINPNNTCNVGNFTCYNANVCNVGNFSCYNANGCAVGNFSCLNANFGTFPFFGNGIFGYPFFFGNAAGSVAVPASGTVTKTVTTNTGQVVIYNPREIAQPAAAPVAQPAANYATALTAPAQAPAAAVTSGGDIHVLSAPPATKPAVTTDADDHRG